jgi:hypothetical protein
MNVVQGAVTAQPSIWRELRGQFFVWFGIVGGAMTIANNWSNFIQVADWVHWVVSHFSAIMHGFWGFLGSLIGIRVPLGLAKILSFILFYGSLTFGAVLMAGKMNPIRYNNVGLKALYYITLFCILMFLCLRFYLSYSTAAATIICIPLVPIIYIASGLMPETEWRTFILIFMVIFLVRGMLYSGINIIIHENNLEKNQDIVIGVCAIIGVMVIFTPMLIAPHKSLNKRLAFLLIGVAIIFGLSEFSKQVEHLKAAATSVETR